MIDMSEVSLRMGEYLQNLMENAHCSQAKTKEIGQILKDFGTCRLYRSKLLAQKRTAKKNTEVIDMHTYMKNTMPTREEVLHFLSTEQHLLGCGSGDGTGHGFGYGDGSGDGSDYDEDSYYNYFLHCYSNAFAHGIGSYYGHCYGNGSGYGSGRGSTLLTGYGNGYGSGGGSASWSPYGLLW